MKAMRFLAALSFALLLIAFLAAARASFRAGDIWLGLSFVAAAIVSPLIVVLNREPHTGG